MRADDNGKLYHVKCHGVTIDIFSSWNAAFSTHEDLVRRHKSCNVQLITIRDTRTPQQIMGEVK